MTRRHLGGLLVAAAATVCLTACGLVPESPGPVPTTFVPSSAPAQTPAISGSLSPDGVDAVERMAVRIRNVGCSGTVSTGSGFALDEHTLITNKHVVSDSSELQLSTYDGRDVAATAASVAGLADLALVRTAEPLPSSPDLAEADMAPGEVVSVVGYPDGGALTVTSGRVIGTVADPLDNNLGQVMVTDAEVAPGSSGSPVLNDAGEVAGVVYAKNSAGQSFAVPVSTLRSILADDAGFTPTQSCDG